MPPNATPVNATVFACGNPPMAAEEHAVMARAFAEERMMKNTQVNAEIPTVNVYFQVLASSEKPEDGWVADDLLQKQMDVLNDNFNKHGIKFQLAKTIRTINETWARGQDINFMASQLRMGSYSDLNIYLHLNLTGGAAGVCTIPVPVNGAGTYNFDGCQILTSSLPDDAPYTGLNDGKAGVHEVGHWFGLFHTFENGCNSPGDYVDDTPSEALPPGRGCEIRNSCPGQPGNDPIHNHMSYTGSDCHTEFTLGQQIRMHNQWAVYRAGR
ncbi:hypothetical protein F5B22DRAFT_645447 [Xylaria bambusicola]|uniref:uncharacterized protein n=1 Tax=Xylaria bambusicola TaxID=326684 RepID=UPI002008A8EB|nr:uncharacterized protein F5B22DRAFT_645447 [Xylaria bambusicola]KAI0517741.1 hypothetical protein F5B22DRAFT_645447 [Xylaria bambusicola]